jgi:hypothetical protein
VNNRCCGNPDIRSLVADQRAEGMGMAQHIRIERITQACLGQHQASASQGPEHTDGNAVGGELFGKTLAALTDPFSSGPIALALSHRWMLPCEQGYGVGLDT